MKIFYAKSTIKGYIFICYTEIATQQALQIDNSLMFIPKIFQVSQGV